MKAKTSRNTYYLYSKKKGYDVEMWDLGLQEWVHVASTEIPELTLSNILVTFMCPNDELT